MPDSNVNDTEDYVDLGSVSACATCPRTADGVRHTRVVDGTGDETLYTVHLCQFCDRAFSLGGGEAPLVGFSESINRTE